MRVLSLFSGVGGFDMGLESAGMTTAFQCEIDKNARAVLDYHWPDVPKWDDVTTLTGRHILDMTGGVDVVAWGSPCQDLSLAGKRAGLSGERSGLFHQGIRIIKELRELSNGKYPTWSVWENVVGALSSNGGADFGEVLHEMDEAGACFSEWAVLDAQYFGVPQRRRRVFVLSCFDSAIAAKCPSKILSVGEGRPGNSAKGRTAGEDSSGQVANCLRVGSGVGERGDGSDNLVTGDTYRMRAFGDYEHDDIASAIKARDHKDNTDLVVNAVPLSFDTQFGSNANVFEDQLPTLKASQQSPSVAYELEEHLLLDATRVGDVRVYTPPVQTLQARMGTGGNQTPMLAYEPEPFTPGSIGTYVDGVGTLRASGGDLGGGSETLVVGTMQVRRLTPLECERLMGWPDNHTAASTNGPVSDTNRYKMCGNGVASPVAQWIAESILEAISGPPRV